MSAHHIVIFRKSQPLFRNHQIENARYFGDFSTESRVTEVLLLLLMDCSHDMRFVSMLSRSPNCGLLNQAMVKSITEDNKPGRRPGRKVAGGQHSQLFPGVSKTTKRPISRYPNGQGNARFNPADVFKLTLG